MTEQKDRAAGPNRADRRAYERAERAAAKRAAIEALTRQMGGKR